jgi:DUF2934 family protein
MAKSARPKRGQPTRQKVTRERASNDARPEHDAIARRAYELYVERGGGHGSDIEDWLAAERELGVRPQRKR